MEDDVPDEDDEEKEREKQRQSRRGRGEKLKSADLFFCVMLQKRLSSPSLSLSSIHPFLSSGASLRNDEMTK